MEHLLSRYERQADDAYAENLDSQRVSPSNVPFLLTYIQRDEAGHIDPDATLNALCEAIRASEEEHEQLRDALRIEGEAGETGWQEARRLQEERDALQAEVERLRERCQLLELQREDVRHIYQRHLGSYVRLAVQSMHDALEAGVVPERLVEDLNELRRAA